MLYGEPDDDSGEEIKVKARVHFMKDVCWLGSRAYIGQLPDGIGCMIETAEGEQFIYDGMFKDGNFHGFGRLIKTDLIRSVKITEGMFKCGKQHSPVIFTFGLLKAQAYIDANAVAEAANETEKGADSFFCDTSKSEHDTTRIGFKFESKGIFKSTSYQLTSKPTLPLKRFITRQSPYKIHESVPALEGAAGFAGMLTIVEK